MKGCYESNVPAESLQPYSGVEVQNQRQLARAAGPVTFDLVLSDVYRFLFRVAYPQAPVCLSAPGGPPERSALSASVLHGPSPRTPCSPIPGVGRL